MSISVIVATYGEPEWAQLALERAAPSAFYQDGVWEVITAHEGHENISSSRNAAAKQADGDWLCFLDADDELAPGYVGAMGRALEQNPCQRILLTPAVQVIRPGRTPGPPTFFKECNLRDANWLVVGTLVHRDLFWEVGGFDDYPHGFEDFSLWSKCVRAGATVVKVPDAVYRYWANPQSAHRQGWRDKKWQRETHHSVIQKLNEWEAARA